tara:strand:- start:1882 stop:2085 length:204 start_codon:yes stop_codon:yes gene_type:complete
LDHVFARGTLQLEIVRARSLAAMDDDGTSDPYLRVFRYENEIGRSEVHPSTLTPEFNIAFLFEIDGE